MTVVCGVYVVVVGAWVGWTVWQLWREMRDGFEESLDAWSATCRAGFL